MKTGPNETRVNRFNKISEIDFYVANGLSSMLLGAKFYNEADEIYARLSEDALALVSEFVPVPTDIKWSSRFNSLRSFFLNHGFLPTTTSDDAGERLVSKWLAKQKVALSAGELSAEKLDLLERYVPVWQRSSIDILWERRFRATKMYFDKNGCLPLRNNDDVALSKLGGWIGTQVWQQQHGKLSSYRKHMLDTELPLWNPGKEDKWFAQLQKAVDFVEKHGRAPVVTSMVPEEKTYALWISRQRTPQVRNVLSEAQIDALNRGLPEWEVNLEIKWGYILDEVCAYFARYNALPKDKHSGKYGSLGTWMQTQKDLVRLGKLTPEREATLDERLPTWRETVQEKWERDLNSVASYFKENHSYPPVNNPDPDVAFLGGWITGARKKLKDGNMSPERKVKLDAAIPHWNDLWMTNLNLVTDFVKEHGREPSQRSMNKRESVLYNWMRRQKHPSAIAAFSTEQIAAMEAASQSWQASISSGVHPERETADD